jgi:NAD(P)-dependent dehydrogenase (short-subunit alcohol dehydrogenase family)
VAVGGDDQLPELGSVRRKTDADRLQSEFGGAFTPLIMDVTDRLAVEQAAAQVGARLGYSTLAGLVNNAGIAVPGALLHLPLTRFMRAVGCEIRNFSWFSNHRIGRPSEDLALLLDGHPRQALV